MLELFTIFTKGGIVLFCFQGACAQMTLPTKAIDETVREVLMQGGASKQYNYKNLSVQFKLDNEFELVFAVVFQKILQLSYLDKLLDSIQLEFRDRYKNELRDGTLWMNGCDFMTEFKNILTRAEEAEKELKATPREMKSFAASKKFEKTAAANKAMFEQDTSAASTAARIATAVMGTEPAATQKSDVEIARENMRKKMNKKGKKKNGIEEPAKVVKVAKVVKEPKKRVKEARLWEMGGKNTHEIDYSTPASDHVPILTKDESHLKGTMEGELGGLEYPEAQEEEGTETKKSEGGGMFSFLKNINLSTNKNITKEMLVPVLEKLSEHLAAKNVACDVAKQLCDSMERSLVGKSYSTFTGLTATARQALSEELTKILSPKRRVDVLRDLVDAKKRGRPYIITFCGVNGVGKSTNLAKICFWLLENGHRVLIVGGDTFRAGAVEQLRTHVARLSALYAGDQVQLYERGYGKDPANLTQEAIKYAKERCYDAVLVDTAGRMQDNEPLMRALSKLVTLNNPDLTLFVGEALVGNEAVDQLVKFNQSLIDNSHVADIGTKSVIDGILLTKFDCIDDKVGAAISMTYITGQPIVFVGTGQHYTDLKALNVKSVVSALLH